MKRKWEQEQKRDTELHAGEAEGQPSYFNFGNNYIIILMRIDEIPRMFRSVVD